MFQKKTKALHLKLLFLKNKYQNQNKVMENRVQSTPKGFLRTISIMHLGFLAGLVIFGSMIFLQNDNWELNVMDTNEVFYFILPIMAVFGIFIGNYLYKQKIDALKSKATLKEKLEGYQQAIIIKFALIEGPAFFGIVGAMISGNLLYLIIALLLAVYFFSLKPTKDKIINDLELSRELKNELNR